MSLAFRTFEKSDELVFENLMVFFCYKGIDIIGEGGKFVRRVGGGQFSCRATIIL